MKLERSIEGEEVGTWMVEEWEEGSEANGSLLSPCALPS